MKSLLPLLFLTSILCIFSCHEEEVLPQQQATAPVGAVRDTSRVMATASQPSKSELTYKDSAYYQSSHVETLPLRILTPRKFDPSQRYPLVIFLHGIAERGTDNERQLRWGSSMFLEQSSTTNYPSFVVFPQCPETNKWVDEPIQVLLRKTIDHLVATCNIDTSRIYIVGLSMGAYGTYATVAANPGLFAAAIAISGDGDANKTALMSKTKWKIFGGKKDEIVSSEKSEKMARALKASGAEVTLTIYADADHLQSWTKAFKEPDFLSWLYSNKK